MLYHGRRAVRALGAVCGAGLLFQAGGCMVEAETLAQGLLTSIAEVLITRLVFGMFNFPVGAL